MTEPNADEKEKLAAKARWIADALGGAKANGGTTGATSSVQFTEEQLAMPLTIGMALDGHKVVMEIYRDRFKQLETHIAALEAHIATLEQRNAASETRIIELAQRPTMHYRGIWDAEETYFVGDFTTRSGSLWACLEPNRGVQPPAGVWQLAVQRGKDGRDR